MLERIGGRREGRGAEVQRGDLADLDVLRHGASSADGVIHLGFIHDFASFAKSAETDRAAIRTMAAALADSNRPLVVTSGTLGAGAPGTIGTEVARLRARCRFVHREERADPAEVLHHALWLDRLHRHTELRTDRLGNLTRGDRVGWKPTQIGLIQDLEQGTYFV